MTLLRFALLMVVGAVGCATWIFITLFGIAAVEWVFFFMFACGVLFHEVGHPQKEAANHDGPTVPGQPVGGPESFDEGRTHD